MVLAEGSAAHFSSIVMRRDGGRSATPFWRIVRRDETVLKGRPRVFAAFLRGTRSVEWPASRFGALLREVRALTELITPAAEHVLDWFHITMRLTVLSQYNRRREEIEMMAGLGSRGSQAPITWLQFELHSPPQALGFRRLQLSSFYVPIAAMPRKIAPYHSPLDQRNQIIVRTSVVYGKDQPKRRHWICQMT